MLLRNLRNKLRDSEKSAKIQSVKVGSNDSKKSSALSAHVKTSRSEDASGSIFKKFDTFLSFTKPLQKMISSKQSVEALASMMIPKRDVLQKLLEIKGHLEPNLRRYLTDKYNGFLSSLVPYSENIGVPPFVLNSMKIPQDFDPRWQFIKTLLDTQGGLDNFLSTVMTGNAFKKLPEVVESRSGDETELISDQEPDASSKGYRKHQQLYLSSFKKRLMKPGNRLKFSQPLQPTLDYESILDQQGQYGHVAYEVRPPDEMYPDAYYSSGGSNVGVVGDELDMAMSASGGGRGHGGGHGGGYGGGQSSYGGFLDPFTILGGLAFLTYLGMMLQNSLNRNNTGRSLPYETRMPVVPINLKYEKVEDPHNSQHRRRPERSLDVRDGGRREPPPLTVDKVVDEIKLVWKDIEELRNHPPSPVCSRLKLCKVVKKLKEMNLLAVFDNVVTASTKEKTFLKSLTKENVPDKLCEPYFTQYSKTCI